MPKRIFTKRKPRFYLRQYVDGRWYFLLALQFDTGLRTRPIWQDEALRGKQVPHLYKTLVGARAGLDRFVSPLATYSQVTIWENVHAAVQTDSH